MIWLTRPQEDSEALATELAARGIPSIIAPVLSISPRTGTDLGDKPDGIILTSRHALAALPKDWRTLPVYAVGSSTAKAAHEAGCTDVSNGGGDALALAAYIVEQEKPGQTLVYLRGEEVRVDLETLLAVKKITVRSVIVYEAKAASLTPRIVKAIKQGKISGVAFFSARSADVATELMEEAGLAAKAKEMEAFCLSLAVADAAGSGWGTLKVAEKPTGESMIKLIASAQNPAINTAMNETETHDHSPSALSILGWLVVMLSIIGASALLRQEQNESATQAATSARQQAAKLASLETQMGELQKQVAAAPAGTHEDGALGESLQDLNARLSTIATHLDEIEAKLNKPALPPAAPVVNNSSTRLLVALQAKLLRGEPYGEELDTLAATPALAHDADAIAALRATAASGSPSDLKLHREFGDILDKTSAATAPSPTMQKMNAHLGGLVTIKPHAEAADSYQPLRSLPADTPVAVLAERAAALPADARAPFDGWLNEVAARDKALGALHLIESRLLPAS